MKREPKVPGHFIGRWTNWRVPALRTLFLIISTILLVLSAWVAKFPTLGPVSSSERSLLSREFWIYAREKNPSLRLPSLGTNFRSVHFVDPQYGWAVGFGTLLATNDGGESWTFQNLDLVRGLTSVHFTDRSRGWVVGSEGTILATTDGGKTWTTQASGTKQLLNSVYFVNAERGWAAGREGTILATTDGGNTWSTQNSGSKKPLASICFADDARGWVVGGGSILATIDGGKSWDPQLMDSKGALASVNFVDSERGWAVGSDGTVLATIDGGTTWAAQAPGLKQVLVSVNFVDSERGWAVGSDGTILATTDGGKKWHFQDSGLTSPLSSVHFVNAERGWCVSVYGDILVTTDGGENWNFQSSGTRALFKSVYFPNKQRGWIVGPEGTILATTDGGRTWNRQTSGSDAVLTSVHFADAERGWVVGTEGTILATNDGGIRWISQSSGTTDFLGSVHFTDTEHGWIVGSYDILLTTTDGGQTWNPRNPGKSSWLNSVYFADAQRGWVVGDKGTILATADGGKNWMSQDSGTSSKLKSVHFVDAERGWIVGDGGSRLAYDGWLYPQEATILATNNGGKNWNLRDVSSTFTPISVHFVDAEHGWAVGNRGTILTTRDGGRTWEPQDSGKAVEFQSVHFVDAQSGWVVGHGGTILATTDGGNRWEEFSAYRLGPAPIFYLLLGVGCLVAVAAFLVGEEESNVSDVPASIEDRISGDHAIRTPAHDVLNYLPLAKALSRHIRNENTLPPLTIAISGPWGCGKSSLMHLLAHDLRLFRFRPVWFNAWHYHKEENLLAALMEKIREEGLPSLFSRHGLLFRYRLIDRRGRRHWFSVAILLILIVIVAWLQLNRNRPEFPWLFDGIDPLIAVLGALGIQAFDIVSRFSASFQDVFPGPLNIVKRLSLGDFSKQTGFRHAFERDFRDTTECLPRPMVLFLDDLDRCPSERLLDLLKTINFLTSAGKCVLILGIDKQRVLKALGKNLPGGDQGSDEATANEFLEKLLNLEVSVPSMKSEQVSALFTTEKANESKRRAKESKLPLWIRILDRGPDFIARVLPWGILIPFFIGVGVFILPDRRTESQEGRTSPKFAGGSTPAQAPPGFMDPGTTEALQTGTPEEADIGGATFTPGQSARISGAYPLIPALLLVLGLVVVHVRFTQRPGETIHDDPRFIASWNIWSSILATHPEFGNPRAIKRFLNRLRLAAALQSRGKNDQNGWEILITKLKKRHGFEPDPIPSLNLHEIPEEALVRLFIWKAIGYLADSDVNSIDPETQKAAGQAFEKHLAIFEVDSARDLYPSESIRNDVDRLYHLTQTALVVDQP